MDKRFFLQVLRFLIILTSIVVLYCIFQYTINWWYPFLIAFIIAKIMHPSVSFLEAKLKLPRSLATLSVIIGLIVCISLLFFLLITEVIDGTVYLADKLPFYFDSLIGFIETNIYEYVIPIYQNLLSWIQSLDTYQQETIEENIKQISNHLSNAGAKFLRGFLLMIPTIILAFPHFLMIIIIILIATFFMLNDWTNLKLHIAQFIPTSVARSSNKVIHHLKRSIYGFIRAQFIIVLISTCIIFTGLTILNIKHALTIALLIGLVDIMPIIGTGLIFIPWLAYLFMTHDYLLTIGLALTYMIVVISRQIIEPKVLASSIGINPLLALIILFFSIQFWGVSGILISPILLITISAFFQAGVIRQVFIFIRG